MTNQGRKRALSHVVTTRGSITVRNAQRKSRIDLPSLEEFSRRALQRILGLPPKAGAVLATLPAVTVVLVSDRRMAALHQKFMNLEGATDVITFQDGDIFVGVETAHRNARHFQTSTADEISLYVIHGLLHLHGFDDTTPAKLRAMKSMQERIQREINPA